MATTPSSIPATIVRGISTTLSGYIIQDISIKETDVSDPTPDQMGATVGEDSYDKRYDLTFSAIGPDTAPVTVGAANFELAGATWKIDSCEMVGRYDAKQKWSVVAHRYTNYPPQS